MIHSVGKLELPGVYINDVWLSLSPGQHNRGKTPMYSTKHIILLILLSMMLPFWLLASNYMAYCFPAKSLWQTSSSVLFFFLFLLFWKIHPHKASPYKLTCYLYHVYTELLLSHCIPADSDSLKQNLRNLDLCIVILKYRAAEKFNTQDLVTNTDLSSSVKNSWLSNHSHRQYSLVQWNLSWETTAKRDHLS